MKNRIKLTEINQFELQNVELNSIKAGQDGICDYACGCNCACPQGDEYTLNNTTNSNAVTTENAGWAVDGTKIAVALTIAIFF